MAVKHVEELLRLAGFRNEDYLHDAADSHRVATWQDVDRRQAAGQISVEMGADIKRHLMEDELSNLSMADYVRLRGDGDKRDGSGNSFDKLRGLAGRYEDDLTYEARARKHQDAHSVYVAQLAHEWLGQGKLNGAEYEKVLETTGFTGALADARRRAGYDQAAPGDLDGRPRDLSPEEANHAGTVAWATALGFAPESAAKADDAPPEPERAGDWSESKLEKFFSSRDSSTSSKED